ncbi:peptidase S8/S53 domain-containing protein [Catenaria anguillulae PL171]|uniref:Peptidase S8/S53 domain-containing protein n=1 Tax=Catenaria anguillulae PL171 TaxID=765915 RepID=A0A1Y2HZQ4_9FUNG|nr:peptidase S8/S53 domain-containing protein [Catenaria anguillulae PL171]
MMLLTPLLILLPLVIASASPSADPVSVSPTSSCLDAATTSLILNLRPSASVDAVLATVAPWIVDQRPIRKLSIGDSWKALAVSITDPHRSLSCPSHVSVAASTTAVPTIDSRTLTWLTALVSDSVDFIELDAILTVTAPSARPIPSTTVRAVAAAEIDAPKCTQSPAGNWGLARIDQPKLPLDDKYVYACPKADGPGVNRASIYMIDTGIFLDHDEFRGGRARWGTNVVPQSPDTDEHGHGTFTAGMAAGITYGVAKAESVHLIAVKALDKDGNGPISQIMDALQWVTNDHTSASSNRNVTICNLSLGGIRSRSLNNAIEATANTGVIITVAAGNEGLDACLTSPSSSSDAITVGATTPDDQLADFSNTGTCVDVLAPGQSLKSAWIGAKDAFMDNYNGTSFSSPMVAGVIAQYAAAGEVDRDMDVHQVRDKLTAKGAKDEIAIRRGLWGWISRTPNVLVQV